MAAKGGYDLGVLSWGGVRHPQTHRDVSLPLFEKVYATKQKNVKSHVFLILKKKR